MAFNHRDRGLHDIGVNAAGHLERTVEFPIDEIDERLGWSENKEDTVTMADAAACWILILEWILATRTLALAGARAASLAIYLDPVNHNRFGSTLAQIAEQAGCTRACLSQALIDFRDSAGIHLSAGKLAGARDTYRSSQINALQSGRHSSQVRRDRKQTNEPLDGVAD